MNICLTVIIIIALQQRVSSCPLDFSVLNGYSAALTAACNEGNNLTTCCQAAGAGVELSLARYLKESNLFLLQNATQAHLCLRRLRAQLQLIGVHRDVVDECSFGRNLTANPTNSTERVSVLHWQPELCHGLQSVQDFQINVAAGDLSSMEQSCNADLGDPNECQQCGSSMRSVQDKLSNNTMSAECSNFVRMYVLVQDAQDPWGAQTAFCLYALGHNSSPAETQKRLYLGIGIVVAVLMSCLIVGVVITAWWRRRESAIHREFLLRNNRY